jgi:ribosomal protein L11 methyltransferase
MKTWPALALRFEPALSTSAGSLEDVVSAALDDLHPTAVQELDDRWLVFFSDDADRDRAAAALPAVAPGSLSVEMVDVADEDWARRSQEGLRAVQVGRITIAPPWAAPRNARLPPGGSRAGPSTIVIQPSMGFGTGHHATTRLCTALIQCLDLAGRTALDVGTGSGVLALVAYALGAGAVIGVDDDPDALESARENLVLNGVTDGIDLRLGDFRGLSIQPADVVMANLTGGLLTRAADILASAVAPGGSLIISGVMLDEEAEVLVAFAPRLQLVERVTEDDWMAARFGL